MEEKRNGKRKKGREKRGKLEKLRKDWSGGRGDGRMNEKIGER